MVCLRQQSLTHIHRNTGPIMHVVIVNSDVILFVINMKGPSSL